MPEEKPWKTEKDVRRLVVGKKLISDIGVFGRVYSGRLYFHGRKQPTRVAVKKFRQPIGDKEKEQYERTAERMRAAGLPIIKTGYLLHDSEWVQVTPLFGSTLRGSTIPVDLREFHTDPRIVEELKKPERLDEMLGIIAGIINLGYSPTQDCLFAHANRTRVKFLVHDIDTQATGEPHLYDWSRFNPKFSKIRISSILAKLAALTEQPLQQITQKLKEKVTHDKFLPILRKIQEETRTTQRIT
ncbi:MAG: hypothetical protein V1644_01250 [Candidatus Micrarchaeota archaeon]